MKGTDFCFVVDFFGKIKYWEDNKDKKNIRRLCFLALTDNDGDRHPHHQSVLSLPPPHNTHTRHDACAAARGAGERKDILNVERR